MPAASRFLKGAEPVLEATHVFMPELNPILSYLSFARGQLAEFITVGGAALAGNGEGGYMGNGEAEHYLPQVAIIDGRSFQRRPNRPDWERANSYVPPNAYARHAAGRDRELRLQAERRRAAQSGGQRRGGRAALFRGAAVPVGNQKFPRLRRGKAPFVPAPKGSEGTRQATP